MRHRNIALALCVLGAFLSWFLPGVVRAIHEADGMATAHEFSTYRLIDQDRLQEVRTEHGMPDYSVEQRIRAVGGLQIYLPVVTAILVTLFATIGILIWRFGPAPSEIEDRPHSKNKSDGEPSYAPDP